MELRHEERVAFELEGLAHGAHGARIGGHAADEGDRGLNDLALGDGAPEVADDGVAQPAQHLRRAVALLLRVDHVALGEHAAAPGDARRLAGVEDDVSHVLDVVQQTAGLLVHEGTGPGGTVAVRLIVGDPGTADLAARLQADELGGLAAHLKDGTGAGVEVRHAPADGLELVLKARRHRLPDKATARAGHANARQIAVRQDGAKLLEERPGSVRGATLDAAVSRDQQRPAAHRHRRRGSLEQIGVIVLELQEDGLVFSLADERRFEADTADIDAEDCHGFELWTSCGRPRITTWEEPIGGRRPSQAGNADYDGPLSTSIPRLRRRRAASLPES